MAALMNQEMSSCLIMVLSVQISQYLFALVSINLFNPNNCGLKLHTVGEVSGAACFEKMLQDHLTSK